MAKKKTRPQSEPTLQEEFSFWFRIRRDWLQPFGEAFLLAMDRAADYESWNFRWFRPRYPHFLYVDRVAVASSAAGGGQGRRLYADLIATARDRGYPLVCAEVNCDPPNDASLAFHARQGFDAVGEEPVPGKAKSVRFFARTQDPITENLRETLGSEHLSRTLNDEH